jgi:uncharacterized protein YacL
MYLAFLVVHSWVRWLVIVTALAAFGVYLGGWLGRRMWTMWAARVGMLFVTAMDLQVLLGLILYLVLSPITSSALRDFGTAMSNEVTRYWAVEHVLFMVLGFIIAHVGLVITRRASTDGQRYQRGTIFFGLATLLILIAVPWPFLSYGRPLFRL